jgi:uncharacterized membrane protein YhaH (DUF805 family)
MKWFIKVLKQYADFNGRARRKEFWMFTLFFMIFGYCTVYIDMKLGTTFNILGSSGHYYGQKIGGGAISFIYCMALIVPYVAVGIRRLHDIGKSGFYYFIGLVPIIGWIILLVWFCRDTQVGDNEYGLNPKASDYAAAK